jgi:quercetin dioxygenase-like cupin family protein
MDSTTFTTGLKASGYDDIAEKHGPANSTSEPHSHPFAVRGLVIAGEFILTKDDVPASYRAGDTFEMDANCIHREASGSEGSVYLVGRKHPQ